MGPAVLSRGRSHRPNRDNQVPRVRCRLSRHSNEIFLLGPAHFRAGGIRSKIQITLPLLWFVTAGTGYYLQSRSDRPLIKAPGIRGRSGGIPIWNLLLASSNSYQNFAQSATPSGALVNLSVWRGNMMVEYREGWLRRVLALIYSAAFPCK